MRSGAAWTAVQADATQYGAHVRTACGHHRRHCHATCGSGHALMGSKQTLRIAATVRSQAAAVVDGCAPPGCRHHCACCQRTPRRSPERAVTRRHERHVVDTGRNSQASRHTRSAPAGAAARRPRRRCYACPPHGAERAATRAHSCSAHARCHAERLCRDTHAERRRRRRSAAPGGGRSRSAAHPAPPPLRTRALVARAPHQRVITCAATAGLTSCRARAEPHATAAHNRHLPTQVARVVGLVRAFNDPPPGDADHSAAITLWREVTSVPQVRKRPLVVQAAVGHACADMPSAHRRTASCC